MIRPRTMAVDPGLVRRTVAACALACGFLLAGCGWSGAPATYAVAASVSGLTGSGLTLQLNTSGNLAVTVNGNSTFATRLTSGMSYQVTVKTQPTVPAQTCSVANGSGTVGTADITGITITCVTSTTILYSFTGGVNGSIDGAVPNGSLVQGADGSLYGTTSMGGTLPVNPLLVPTGTVFKVTLSGQETVLHTFGIAAGDGSCVIVGLILGSDGNFYGMTVGSTQSLVSTIYQIGAAGAETVIYQFPLVSGVDDFPPLGNLIQGSDGLLYSAHYDVSPGGASYSYVIYGVTTTGMSTFAAGIGPITNLTRDINLIQTSDGSLYGTTDSAGAYGMGGVFKVKPDVAMLYSFGGMSGDALAPLSPMIQGNDGNLYGTTATGGTPNATCPKGCGTVFKVTPSGVETVLYSFGGAPSDGQGPSGALVQASDGNFYGMTVAGGSTASSGSSNCSSATVILGRRNIYNGYKGCGTIYRITPTGVETVLYSFGSAPEDGVEPTGALLLAADGNLYGTTTAGGAGNAGTVFKVELGAK